MIKTHLVDCVSNVVGTKALAEKIVNTMLAIIGEAVLRGETVNLPNFGTFKLVQRQARKGRNPRTGEEVPIPARKVMTFTPSASLKKEISDYTL